MFYILFQFNYFDYLDKNTTFGPIFNREEFLLPLLELQKQIMNITIESEGEVISLKDVCNNPLSRPDRKTGFCNIQSIWSYWQDDQDIFDEIIDLEGLGVKNLTYLDHFLMCAR